MPTIKTADTYFPCDKSAFFFGLNLFGGSYLFGFGFLEPRDILFVVLDDATMAGFVASKGSAVSIKLENGSGTSW